MNNSPPERKDLDSSPLWEWSPKSPPTPDYSECFVEAFQDTPTREKREERQEEEEEEEYEDEEEREG